ncbi:hypothetical protein H2200_007357 [Cladophialophora chaetospira]|uniref:BAG domain-containing protein n=1 Tax=Cladophialophora chaetospira TaxID=386627 RepID=A0AA39CHE1_9EURO|nr:hypothetical protein H2200_007357 [Cladophialophora chaetospira]
MSSYGGGYIAYGGSRNGGSPYTSNVVDPYARNLSNHFEYIDADQGMLQDNHRHSVYKPHDTHHPLEDPDEPDVVLVRHMAQMLQIEFPPYSISEETAYVGQLRDKVARHLQTDPRRIRLLYKKRDLKHDSLPLRKYNVKQNSEVTAIKTEGYLDYSDKDSHSSSGEDVPETNPRRRPRAPSSVRHRSDENLPRVQQPSSTSSTFLHPNGHIPSGAAAERQSRPSLKPEFDDRPIRREPSRSRGTSPHPQTSQTAPPRPAPSSTPIPTSLPKADPKTPLGQLQTLSDTFHEQWLPLCRKFMTNPPSSLADREKEHRRISESVMTHIILKADAVEVDSQDARGFRKGLLHDVHEAMKRIDAVAKA